VFRFRKLGFFLKSWRSF